MHDEESVKSLAVYLLQQQEKKIEELEAEVERLKLQIKKNETIMEGWWQP